MKKSARDLDRCQTCGHDRACHLTRSLAESRCCFGGFPGAAEQACGKGCKRFVEKVG